VNCLIETPTKISVGAALIGMSPAQCIHWRDPDGRIRILTVLDVRGS